MKISQELVEYQNTHTFEETVAKYMHKVVHELTHSALRSKVYEATWVLRDGSKAYLKGEQFSTVDK